MASNWQNLSNQMGSYGQMGGGMRNYNNAANQFNMMGGGGGGFMGGGMPTFSQFNQWSNQMGQRPQQSSPYQVGQNKPIDSNAGLRDPNANYTPVNPYGMNQSNQNSWTGNGWTSNRGTPVPESQLGGYMNRPPQGQSERPQQQWNPGPNTGTRTPYQIQPGGQGPISVDPRSGPWQRPPESGAPGWNQGWGPRGGPSPGPRPRGGNSDNVIASPNLNLMAPGQQQYNGPKITPMGQPPQSAFGQQNPTRFISGFHPQGPAPWNPSAGGPQQQQGPYRTY
jgi:hypothetical protein